ncbi:MAG: CBS domain-containing protein [Candidatus Competibacteraceae bacterium]
MFHEDFGANAQHRRARASQESTQIDDRTRGNLVGMLSEKDCMKVVLQASYHEERAGNVSEYMSRNVKTVNLDDSLLDVARMFLEAPYKRYPVMRDNVLVGQISRKDVLKALKDLW